VYVVKKPGIPVVQQYIWCPDEFRRQANALQTAILAGIPTQPVVVPLLAK